MDELIGSRFVCAHACTIYTRKINHKHILRGFLRTLIGLRRVRASCVYYVHIYAAHQLYRILMRECTSVCVWCEYIYVACA